MIPSAAWRYWRLNDPFAVNVEATLQQRLPMLFNGPDNSWKLLLSLEGFASPSNTWFLGLTLVFFQNGILIGLAIFFCTAHHRVSHYFTMSHYLSSKIGKKYLFSLGDWIPHLTHSTWGPPKSLSQAAYRSISHFWVPIAVLYNALSVGKKTSKIDPFL